jgi:type I restriction enzyme, S subunit
MINSTEWQQLTVGDVVERHYCGPSPDCEEREVFAQDEWGVLKTTAITWSGWDERAHKVLPKAYWGKRDIEVHAGDVLVTKAGPRNRVGVICHVPSTRPQLVVSGKMIGLRPKADAIKPLVLAGLLATKCSQKYIQDRTTGMAESQVNFSNEVLLTTPLQVPPIVEQQLIVKILDALDITIRDTEEIIDKLKAVKQGLLHDLLTRGIGASGELRPPQSEAPHLYKQSSLGWVPSEWTVRPLREILSESTKNGLYKPSQFHGRGPLMVQMGGLFRGEAADFQSATRVHVSPSELNTFGLAVGDLLFARRSLVFEGAGLCVIVRHLPELATYESSIVRARVSEAEARPEFVCQFLRGASSSAQRRTLIRQVAVSGVSSSDIGSLFIALPTLAEQDQIIERQFSVQYRIDRETIGVQKLRDEKKGLMDDLLTGRVRVTPLLDS